MRKRLPGDSCIHQNEGELSLSGIYAATYRSVSNDFGAKTLISPSEFVKGNHIELTRENVAECAPELYKKIKIILKSAGLDGAYRKKYPHLAPVTYSAEEHLRRAEKIHDEVEHDIWDCIDISKPGVEDRIEALINHAQKYELCREKMEPLVAKGREKLMQAIHNYKNSGPVQKAALHKTWLDLDGINLSTDPMEQYERGLRQGMWSVDLEAINAEIDVQLKKHFKNERHAAITAKNNGNGNKGLSPAQRMLERTRQKNLSQKTEKLENRNKATTPGLLAVPETAKPAQKNKVPSAKSILAQQKAALRDILRAARADLAEVKSEIKTEKVAIPKHREYLEGQTQALIEEKNKFITLRRTAIGKEGEKKGILASLSALGEDVSSLKTAEDPRNITLNAAEDFTPLSEGEAEKPSLPDPDNRDIEEYKTLFPDSYEEIVQLRIQHNKARDTLLDLQAESAVLSSQIRHAELQTNKFTKLASRLDNMLSNFEREIPQLTEQLMAVRQKISINASFNKEARYPPLSAFGAWVAANLDPERIVIHPDAIKETEASLYNDPDLIYDAIKLLEKEYREQRTSGNLPQDEKDRLRNAYIERERALGLVCTSAQIRHSDHIALKHQVVFDGRKYDLNHHLKKGKNKDPRYTLRVYFNWDKDDRRVLVGHMPGHLPTIGV
ncbi:MAG: hypothetical protein IT559_07415 [Alphaproteobacteria bacterium]|nr:hypothetical protein [Alphaproteobacteria bacterium]